MTDELAKIARVAANRAEQRYVEAMASLPEPDRRMLATHIAFALLLVRVRQLAGPILQTAGTFTVRNGLRQVSCTLSPEADHILVEWWGDPAHGYSAVLWTSPLEIEPRFNWLSTNELAEQIARHLAR